MYDDIKDDVINAIKRGKKNLVLKLVFDRFPPRSPNDVIVWHLFALMSNFEEKFISKGCTTAWYYLEEFKTMTLRKKFHYNFMTIIYI